MKPKAMIGQRLRNMPADEIEAARAKAKAFLEAKGYEVVDTCFREEWGNWDGSETLVDQAIWRAVKSIEQLASCDAIYMCKGWEIARRSRVEHFVAMEYGVDIFYEGKEEEGDEPV